MIATVVDGRIVCDWYVTCTQTAAGVARHPALEYVPTCRRCADRHDLDLLPATIDIGDRTFQLRP